jgi:tetratricopeptide (TPR) repeat protein
MTMLFRASRIHPFRLIPLAALTFAAQTFSAQAVMGAPPAAQPSAAAKTPAGQTEPDRSSAYYHYGLAHLYEEMAVNAGRPDYATQAVEEYKLALDADPNSAMLQDGLAELYFKIGRPKDAISAAEEQVKRNPDDVEAHTLLGQVYLQSLRDSQGAQSTELLQHAITEYETISRLKPDDVETKLLLGQLYALNHDSAHAEAEFKSAQKIDANSEEVVLSMARLYSENGDMQRAVDTLSAVPVDDRSARIEFALGESLDELKKPKEAAAAYRRALDIDPDNADAQAKLAGALLEDDKLDEALAIFNQLVAANPSDVQSEIHISEIQRRQGHYDQALATLEKAKTQVQDGGSLELSVNEALIYDALGKYDQATSILTGLLDQTSHPEGKYSEQEKQARAYFLSRLGVIYSEQNKTPEAVGVYKQMIGLGGDDYAEEGYEGEIDAYRQAHQWKEATSVAADAAKALPKNATLQMVYAGQIADTGQIEPGLALAKTQVAATPDNLDVREKYVEMYIRLKRFKEAGEQLDKAEALATKPNEKVSVFYLRGEFFERQKMFDQAEVQFRKALAIDPHHAGVLNYLGYMLADQGQKLPEALKMIREAVDEEPQYGAYLDSLGWVYFKLGQYPEAEENLRKAIDRMSDDPALHDHLGEVYEKTGKLKQAVAQWERSMTEYAHSLPADADPEDVQKVQHKLENARVKLAKLSTSADKEAK